MGDAKTEPVAEPGQAGLSLIVVADGFHATYPLPARGRVVIGRASDADVLVDLPSISRRHARLDIGDNIRITDLGSANGTRTGGLELAPDQTVVVPANQQIELGDAYMIIQRRAAAPPRRVSPQEQPAEPVLVDHPALRPLLGMIERVARGTINVLLQGETGVGKEIFAERIHRLSARAGRPLIKINCAALSEQLLESELFGYERGAFTGADRAKPGLLEAADGGTVFFDEVADLPPAIQAKLLRVLEDRKIQRLGALSGRAVDVRLIAACNRDLAAEVARGAFRDDLRFRLEGVVLAIPPLRERVAEIAPMARFFLAQAAAQAGMAPPELSAEAVAVLERQPWPGNIRELRNLIERSVLLHDTRVLLPEHLALGRASPPGPAAADMDLRSSRQEHEQARIVDALQATGGNQTKAAKLLGIGRRTLITKMELYGLDRPRKR